MRTHTTEQELPVCCAGSACPLLRDSCDHSRVSLVTCPPCASSRTCSGFCMAQNESSEWRWLWREVRPFAPYQAVSLVFMLSSTTLGLTGPLLMKWMIDDILPNRRWGALATATALFFGVYVGRSLLGSLSGLVNMFGVQRIVLNIRKRILKHLQSRSAAFYGKHPGWRSRAAARADVNMVSDAGSTLLPSVLRMVVEIVMTSATMIFLDWRLSSIVVPLLPLFVYVRYRSRAILRKSAEEVREATGSRAACSTRR